MFYSYFRKKFLELKNEIDEGVQARLPLVKWPANVSKKEYIYLDDNQPLHKFNIYTSDLNYNKDLPLIIDIHGGAGVYGDKDLNDLFCYDFALRGFNVTSCSYRLLDKYNLKDQIIDIFNYLHYLKDNHIELGINFNKVILAGDSAGGTLALFVYAVNQRSDLQELFNVTPVDINFDCFFLNHPVADISIPMHVKNKRFLEKYIIEPGLKRNMYGRNYKRNELYKLTSNPHRLLKGVDINNLLIVTSDADIAYNLSSRSLHNYLELNNINHTYYNETDINSNHVFNLIDPDGETGSKCNNFIEKFMKESIK